MDDDSLEAQLTSYASRVAAATYRFLVAVAEYDRREAWARWECRSMAGWLSWKCAMSPAAAKDHVRVARCLERLPHLADRFARGEVSYSQARAISRVATAATEEQLVDLARSMTAAQLEAVVRAYRGARRATLEAAQKNHAGRRLDWHYDDDGCVVGTFRLAPEDGALVAKALDGLVDAEAVADAERDGAEDPGGAARADALVALAERSFDQPAAAGPDSRDRYLVTVITEPDVLAGDNPDATCQIADGPALAAETARRLTCGDSPQVELVEDHHGRILDVGRRHRQVNRALRQALDRRDHGHCAYPGCTRRSTQAHHIVHWARGGATRLDNLISLCPTHHRRHHEGGYTITTSHGRPCFRRADGRPIPVATPLPVTAHPEPDPLAPHGQGCSPAWDGSHLDLPTIIDNLHQDEALA